MKCTDSELSAYIGAAEKKTYGFASVYKVANVFIRVHFDSDHLKNYFDSQMKAMLCSDGQSMGEERVFANITVFSDPLPACCFSGSKETEYVTLSDNGTQVRIRRGEHLNGLLISWNALHRCGVVAIDPGAVDRFIAISHNLTPLFQMMAEELGVMVIHAAVVGKRGKGILIGGKSGSGKSTLAVACMNSGMEFVSDDTVLYDPKERTAFPVCSTCHMAPDFISRFSMLELLGSAMTGGRANKRHFDVSGFSNLVDHIKIVAIVIPKINSDNPSGVIPIQKAGAIREIVFSTTNQLGIDPNCELSRKMFHDLLQFRTLGVSVNRSMSDNAAVIDRILDDVQGEN